MRVLGKKLNRVIFMCLEGILPTIVDKKGVESVGIDKSVDGIGQAVIFFLNPPILQLYGRLYASPCRFFTGFKSAEYKIDKCSSGKGALISNLLHVIM
jgi:hypothetical protein